MSGHSKWANIRIRKGAQDKKRGKIFTRHSKLIEIAAREGGVGDSAMNPRLLTAIENAKADSVPNANIDRAVKKGTGELKGDITESITYEAYGPGSVACIIECLTDNKNRTLNSVRSAIEKRGGKWAASGSVMFLFAHKGVVIGRRERGVGGRDTDALELQLIDAGAENIEWSNEDISVTTDSANWHKIRDVLKNAGMEIEEAGLKYVAKQEVAVQDLAMAKSLMEFLEAIEEDEDVSEVHTNADIAEDVAQAL